MIESRGDEPALRFPWCFWFSLNYIPPRCLQKLKHGITQKLNLSLKSWAIEIRYSVYFYKLFGVTVCKYIKNNCQFRIKTNQREIYFTKDNRRKQVKGSIKF